MPRERSAMTLTVTKTKAEQALSANFDAVAALLPGSQRVADARKAAIGAFAALGLPHRRIEEWKYTDLRTALKDALPPLIGDRTHVSAAAIDAALGPLAALDAHRLVFVNGTYRREFARGDGAAGLEFTRLGSALAEWPETAVQGLVRMGAPRQDAIVALNSAFVTDGAILRIAPGTRLKKPLLLVFAHAGEQRHGITVRNVISAGAGAEATLIEAFVALPGAAECQVNTLTDIALEERAAIAHVKYTLEGAGSAHFASWLPQLGASTVYRGFQLTAGTGLVRNQVFVRFTGEGGRLDLSGSFLGRGSEHIDTTLLVDHAVPGCESRELFKGVLAERARGVFQGKIIVRPNAQRTDGKQVAQALMLSEDAEFDSKPELEINADDVACGHGSTCAALDPDMLFYLRSRGIPLPEARALLIESFVGEAIDKVEQEPVRAALMSIAKAWLAETAAQADHVVRRG
jgi:Fe-S cluster assembly protein SufD